MLRIIETDGGGRGQWDSKMGAKENYCLEPAGGQSWDQELGGGDMGSASLPPPRPGMGSVLGWGQCWAGAAGGPPGQVKKSDPLRAWRTLGWLLPGTGTPSPGEWQQERPQREEGSRWWLCCRSSSLLHNRVMGVSILEMAGMLKP